MDNVKDAEKLFKKLLFCYLLSVILSILYLIIVAFGYKKILSYSSIGWAFALLFSLVLLPIYFSFIACLIQIFSDIRNFVKTFLRAYLGRNSTAVYFAALFFMCVNNFLFWALVPNLILILSLWGVFALMILSDILIFSVRSQYYPTIVTLDFAENYRLLKARGCRRRAIKNNYMITLNRLLDNSDIPIDVYIEKTEKLLKID